jgi:GNAT superfamily N-acetyltransferase
VTVKPLSGKAFELAIPALALLRIKIFRSFPYLYDGDLDYEARYLDRFRDADGAFLAAALDEHGRVAGAATAAPLAGEADEFRTPFERAGHDVSRIFYFAESLLEPEFRGQGIGHRFFDLREAHARSFGTYDKAVFCSVVRPADHPARPAGYQPLDGFWRKRGYQPVEGVIAHYSWKDVGDTEETTKPMQFWMRDL